MSTAPTHSLDREPFILLDVAGNGAKTAARLYHAAEEIVAVHEADDIAPALTNISSRPGHWAGYLAYEAGLAIEPKLRNLLDGSASNTAPLLWFARFRECSQLASTQVNDWLDLARRRPGGLGPMRPAIGKQQYGETFARIAKAIEDGDVYQVNLTFPLTGSWSGDPRSIYARIRPTADASHGAYVFDGARSVLSFSPELFFDFRDGVVTARPMKGTMPRGHTPEEDECFAARLRGSAKDRAENLMIVDLMRNDLSRISVPGSVHVDRLFDVETYPTLHQMTSSIGATVESDVGIAAILRALFPCGSITGAPKIRAMQLIHELEASPRGVYCGSIGHIDPAGDAQFNVAIRTLVLGPNGLATMSVGSGIVADSSLESEWEECLLKARFLQSASQPFA